MADAFLKTKLIIPPLRPQLVPRPRLGDQLRRALDVPLTLVSAPAGYGKTSLVVEWLTERMKDEGRRMKPSSAVDTHPSSFIPHPSSFAWLSLDTADDVPIRFWRYVIAALESAMPGVTPSLAALDIPQPPPARHLLTPLLNAIIDRPEQVLLVLDDYHHISQPEIHNDLAFMIDHAPPNLHLLLTTRADPPLPLYRWRARGQLLDIRAEALRFDNAEAAELLTGKMALTLSETEVIRLAEQTEGWIAGLQLAGLAMQGAPLARHNLIERLAQSNRYIVDYLAEEVLAQQPESLRDFLLKTSILNQLCAELCDAVLKLEVRSQKSEAGEQKSKAGSAELEADNGVTTEVQSSHFTLRSSHFYLQELERANLFLIPIDQERRWYRYHQLFADLLRGQLRRQYPDLLPTLHRRAAEWYATHGAVEAAIEHALAGQDDQQAVQLIDGHAGNIIMEGRGLTVERWLHQLPESRRQRLPRASLAFAWTLLLRGRFGEIETQLRYAEAAVGPDDHALWGEIYALRAILVSAQGRAAEALEIARRARASTPGDNLFVQAMSQYSLAEALLTGGDVDAAIVAYEQTVARCHAAKLLFPELLSRSHLGALCYLQGRLHRAEAATRPVLASLLHHPAAGAAQCALGEVLLAWNRLDEAEQVLEQGLAMVRQSGDATTLVRGQALLARLRRFQGNPAAAQAILDSAFTDLAGGAPVWVAPFVVAEQLQLQLEAGVTASEHLLDEYPTGINTGNAYVREVLPLARVRLKIAQGRHADALALLEELARATEAGGRQGRLIEALALRAVVHEALGDEPAAHADLERALTLAAPEGHVRVFIDAGPVVATLLRRMKDEGRGMKSYITRLLSAFSDRETIAIGSDLQPSALSPQPLDESLTEREHEILLLLARGLTYQQIADELIVSVNTVRHHIKGLYGKLQSDTRTLALDRARELGLL